MLGASPANLISAFQFMNDQRCPSLWLTMTLAAMAGGLAWGIRGQYGHETGAMIAGVLVGFTLVLLWGQTLSTLSASRAVALFALGISVGGSMTYGQTVGLTHDGPLIGNWDALMWGLLGLSIKGGVWIGLGGTMFAMGLSGKRYALVEVACLMLAMMVALLVGVQLLNRPYDPGQRLLPTVYFSDHWYWEPDVDSPRRERWGGLLCALVVLTAYLGFWKRDGLATRLALWSFLGGAIGFPLGQAVQATHAWNTAWFAQLPTHAITQYFNWWNMMETTFGATFGAVIGLGLWRNRARVVPNNEQPCQLLPVVEWVLLAVHVAMLCAWDFGSFRYLDRVAGHALPMIMLPTIAVIGGRYWPFLVALPIVLIPIAGKTVRQLVYHEPQISSELGWSLYVCLPILIALAAALYFARPSSASAPSRQFSAWGLVITTWLYFGLNFAFFDFPWPWREWTGRTPNGILFLVFALSLTLVAVKTIVRSDVQAKSAIT